MSRLLPGLFAHAFGTRYELPIPLIAFVLGGAAVVAVSFAVLQRRPPAPSPAPSSPPRRADHGITHGIPAVTPREIP